MICLNETQVDSTRVLILCVFATSKLEGATRGCNIGGLRRCRVHDVVIKENRFIKSTLEEKLKQRSLNTERTIYVLCRRVDVKLLLGGYPLRLMIIIIIINVAEMDFRLWAFMCS